jgi:hypothetical protein
MAFFKILSCHLSGKSDENNENVRQDRDSNQVPPKYKSGSFIRNFFDKNKQINAGVQSTLLLHIL